VVFLSPVCVRVFLFVFLFGCCCQLSEDLCSFVFFGSVLFVLRMAVRVRGNIVLLYLNLWPFDPS
jgi:hypothetical protein